MHEQSNTYPPLQVLTENARKKLIFTFYIRRVLSSQTESPVLSMCRCSGETYSLGTGGKNIIEVKFVPKRLHVHNVTSNNKADSDIHIVLQLTYLIFKTAETCVVRMVSKIHLKRFSGNYFIFCVVSLPSSPLLLGYIRDFSVRAKNVCVCTHVT